MGHQTTPLLGETKPTYIKTGCFTSKYVILLFLVVITVVLAVVCFLPYYINLTPSKPFPGVWPTTPCNVTNVEIVGTSRVIYTIEYLGLTATITSTCGKYGCFAAYLEDHTYTCAYKATDHSSVYFEDQLDLAHDNLMVSGSIFFGVFAGSLWLSVVMVTVMLACRTKRNVTNHSTSHFFGNDVSKIPSAYRNLVLEDFEGNEVVLWTGVVPKDYRGKMIMVYVFIIALIPLQLFIMGMAMNQYNLATFGLLIPFLLAFSIYVVRIPNYNLITNRRVVNCKCMMGMTIVTSLPYHSVTRMNVSSSIDIDHLSTVSVANNSVAVIFPNATDAPTIENLMLKYMHRDQVAALLGDKARSFHSAGSDCSYKEWTRPAPQPLSELQNAHLSPFARARGRHAATNIQSDYGTSSRRYIKLHMVDLTTYDAAYPTELLGLIGHHEYSSMIAGLNAELKKNVYKVCGSRGLAMSLFVISIFLIVPLFYFMFKMIETSKKTNVYIEQLNSSVLRARRLELMYMVFGQGKRAVRSLVIAVDAL